MWLAKTSRMSNVFLGFCGGTAVCKQGDIGYMGPVVPSSDIGEELALMWSLALVRRLPNYVPVENCATVCQQWSCQGSNESSTFHAFEQR